MWGLPFYETFSKLYLNIYIRYLNMLWNCCQSRCHLKSKHHWWCYCFSDYANKKWFYLLIFKYKTWWIDLCVGTFWTSSAHINNTVIISVTIIVIRNFHTVTSLFQTSSYLNIFKFTHPGQHSVTNLSFIFTFYYPSVILLKMLSEVWWWVWGLPDCFSFCSWFNALDFPLF